MLSVSELLLPALKLLLLLPKLSSVMLELLSFCLSCHFFARAIIHCAWVVVLLSELSFPYPSYYPSHLSCCFPVRVVIFLPELLFSHLSHCLPAKVVVFSPKFSCLNHYRLQLKSYPLYLSCCFLVQAVVYCVLVIISVQAIIHPSYCLSKLLFIRAIIHPSYCLSYCLSELLSELLSKLSSELLSIQAIVCPSYHLSKLLSKLLSELLSVWAIV